DLRTFFGSDSFNLTLGIQHCHASTRQESNACGISLRAGQCDAFFGRYRLAKSIWNLQENACAIARISLCTCRAAVLQIEQSLDALVHDVAGSASMHIRDECDTTGILFKFRVIEPLRAWNKGHGVNLLFLAIEVEFKFLRGWAQTYRRDFVIVLVLDIGVDEVFSKHIALGEEVVVCLECLQR